MLALRRLVFVVVLLSSVVALGAADAPPVTPAPPSVPPARPLPPKRAPDGPGAPRFNVAGTQPGDTALRAAPGANAPATADGDWLVGPDYISAPELTVVPGAPVGRIEQFVLNSADSKFYPGIAREAPGTADPANPLTLVVKSQAQPYQRTITVYVPAQYRPGTAAPFIVVHDGPRDVGKPDPMLPRILDNLIAQGRVPAMVAVMIANGGGDAQGSQRGLEYDTMSGRFAEFIQAEVLPAVEARCGVKLTDDPDGRAVMGNSSGGAAAFTMAWYHPEWYRRVLCYSGTFINQQWPFDPVTPGGAWEYHNRLIEAAEPKPLRIWLHVSDRDLYNPNALRDGMHDWVMANHRMAAVLRAKGYAYQYVFSLDSVHVDRKVREQTLPSALEWLWRGYAPKG